MPLAAALDRLTVGHLLVVALGAGVARVFFETADQVYLPVLLRPEQLPEGNAKLQATQTASYVVGPGLAGLIAQLVGAVAALLLDALTLPALRGVPAAHPHPRTPAYAGRSGPDRCAGTSPRGCASSSGTRTCGCSRSSARPATSG